MEWLAREDPTTDGTVMTIPVHSLLVRYAVVVAYFAMGGPQWKDDCHFLTNTSVCDWHQEFRHDEDDDVYETSFGVHCDNDGVVTKLVLGTW